MNDRYVKLEDVCNKASSNIAQKNLDSCVGVYPIYGASGLITHVNFYQREKEYIAIVKDGAGVGRTMLLPAKSSVIGTLQYIIPNFEQIDIRYLYFVIVHMELGRYFSGATIPHIYFRDYQKECFKLPSPARQKSIADIFQNTDSIIEERQKQLSLLDELVKSRFIEMFGDFKFNSMGWPVMAFDEIAIIDGNMTTDYKKCADFPHVGIDSIEKDTGALKGYRTVSEDGVISGKYMFTPDHIIYSKIRPNLNKVALPDFSGVCSADAYPILPIKEKCNRIFLAYNMRSKFFLDYILQYCSRTNLPKVNRKEVAGFETPLPPLALQTQFAAFVTQVDKSKFGIQKSLEKLETLKKALMQQYFG